MALSLLRLKRLAEGLLSSNSQNSRKSIRPTWGELTDCRRVLAVALANFLPTTIARNLTVYSPR